MLLGRFGIRTPSGSFPIIADTDLSYRDPGELKELRADNVFVLPGMDGEKIVAVVEVQTSRPKHDRTLAWPCYVTRARAVHDCKAFMLVIATNRDASLGSDRVLEIGQYRFDFLPHVLGGHRDFPKPLGLFFPAELTLLNILIGKFDLSSHDVRMFALVNIKQLPPQRRERYARYLRAFASDDARLELEELMEFTFKDAYIDGWIEKGMEKGMERGRIDEAVKALLMVLTARGLALVDNFRGLIDASADPEQIERWLSRAATATTIDEVFAA